MLFAKLNTISTMRRNRWLIITVFALAGIFVYYYTVILYNNESRLKERSFRGLSVMAENIQSEINNTAVRNAKNFVNEYNQPYKIKYRREIEKNYGLKYLSIPANRRDSEIVKTPSTIFFWKENLKWNLKFQVSENEIAYTDVESFLTPLLRPDFFEHYVLLTDEKTIYEDIAGSFDVKFYDSLKKRDQLRSGQVMDIVAEGRNFRLFALPFLVNGEEWLIGGLMSINQFKKERQQLSSNVIMALVFLFFVCLLLFPFMKCFFMNREEHLNKRDVIFSFISFYLLASTFTIVILDLYAYQSLFRNGREQQLHTLGTQISYRLKNDIDSGISQLKQADIIFSKLTGGRDPDTSDISSINNKPQIWTGENNSPMNDTATKTLQAILPYREFIENINWIDANGQQRIRWTANSYIPQKISVRERNYFRKIINGEAWTDGKGNDFFLDAVNSWVAGKKLGILSMKSSRQVGNHKGDTASVMTMGYQMPSVFNTVLPDGFGFCIINKDGKVIFHHKPGYEIGEDFIDETGNNKTLRAALFTSMQENFTEYYNGIKLRFNVQPVTGIPIYVVTFADISMLDNSNVALLSAVSIIVFLQALLIFLSALLIQLFRVKYNSLGYKKTSLSWMKPDMQKEDNYHYIIWLYTYMSLVLIFSSEIISWACSLFNCSGYKDYMFTAALLITYSLLAVGFSYFLVAVKKPGKNNLGTNSFLPLTGIIILYLLFVVIFSVNLGRGPLILLACFLVLQAIPFLLIWRLKNISTLSQKLYGLAKKIFIAGINTLLQKKYTTEDFSYNWKFKYFFAFLLFIILTGIIPAWKTYQQCYNEETLLLSKMQQLHFANSIWKQELKITDTSSVNGSVYFCNPLRSRTDMSWAQKNSCEAAPGFYKFSWFYRAIRPSYNNLSKRHESLSVNRSYDSAFTWCTDKNLVYFRGINKAARFEKYETDTLELVNYYYRFRLPGQNNSPGLLKTDMSIHKSQTLNVIFFYINITLLIIGIYLLIREYLRRVFFPPNIKLIEDQTDFLKQVIYSSNCQNLLVVGIPDSGKGRSIEAVFKQHKPNCVLKFFDLTQPFTDEKRNEINQMIRADENNRDEEQNNRQSERQVTHAQVVQRYFICRNFEYCFNDPAKTEEKLNLLEMLLRVDNSNIILLSTTQQLPFIDEYFDTIKNADTAPAVQKKKENEKEPGEKEDKTRIATIAAERWMNVMNNFQVFIFRWQDKKGNTFTLTPQTDFITRECSHSDFLFNMRSQLFEMRRTIPAGDTRRLEKFEEEQEVRLSQVASLYYDSLWFSLSKDERKVLYDFAKDELVNYNNIHEISTLVQKGVFIINKEQLQLMNKSLRNYILTRLREDDLVELETNEKQKGSWNKIRNVLVAVILIAGTFIFITQREALNSLTAYLSAFSGGIIALLNILNRIPGGAK